MKTIYQHTQKGFLMLSILGASTLLLAILTVKMHGQWIGIALLALAY